MVGKIMMICKDHYLFKKKWFTILVVKYQNRQITEGRFRRQVITRIRDESQQLHALEIQIKEL